MELRTLRYLVAVVDEGSITHAARSLHVTQPTLSRQLAQLEGELGCPLFLRGRGGITLTERGAVLNRYARSILELADEAEEEVAIPRGDIAGTVRIGAGETRAFQFVAQACARVRARHPRVSFEIHDGTSADLADLFARGLYDFLLDCSSGENPDLNQVTLPLGDAVGIVMPASDPLAALDEVRAQDLLGRPVIASPVTYAHLRRLSEDAGVEAPELAAVHGLPLNSRHLVQAGLGVMVTYDGLVSGEDTAGDLCFRPLAPRIELRHKVLWRKVMLTKPAQAFLDELLAVCDACV